MSGYFDDEEMLDDAERENVAAWEAIEAERAAARAPKPIVWRRTPYGYLSTDGRWFLERGGRMTHGANAWLVWEKTGDEPDPEAGISTCRTFEEVTGLAGDGLFLDTGVEGGWLSEAKFIVDRLVDRTTG